MRLGPGADGTPARCSSGRLAREDRAVQPEGRRKKLAGELGHPSRGVARGAHVVMYFRGRRLYIIRAKTKKRKPGREGG